MKKPYRLRWESKFFVRAIIFGVVFFTLQLVLNYPNTDKIKELDMVFWNSFFTLAMTYCAYVTQIVYSDFKERQCQIHRPQNHKVFYANRALCRILISRDSDCDWNTSLQRGHVCCYSIMRVCGD